MQLIKSLISWVLLVAWAPSRCWKEWNKNCLIDDNNFLSARASAYKRIIVILLVNDDKYLPLPPLLCFFLFFYEASISLIYSVEYFSKKNQPKFYLVYIYIRIREAAAAEFRVGKCKHTEYLTY